MHYDLAFNFGETQQEIYDINKIYNDYQDNEMTI